MDRLLLLLCTFLLVPFVGGADAYLWRKGQTRIMALGDSITNAGPGWRTILQDLMRDDGWTYRMVGGRNEPLLPEGYSTYASGFGGWEIGGLPSCQEFGGGNADWKAQRPDLILLHIGTNDLQWGHLEGADRRLSQKLEEIWADLPQVVIIVAQIIPGSDTHSVNSKGAIPYNSQVEAFNKLLPAVVAEKRAAGHHCLLVDQATGFDKSTMLKDAVHPNEIGYRRMAQAWLDAMRSCLAGERPPGLLPPLVNAHAQGATTATVGPGAPLTLQGVLADSDGKHPVSYQWSKACGPGAVAFAHAQALSTTATFSVPGAYAVRLTASCDGRSSCDYLRVLVSGPVALGGTGSPGHAISIAFNDATGLHGEDKAGFIPRSHWNVIDRQMLDKSMPFRLTALVDDSGMPAAISYRFAGNSVGSVKAAMTTASADGKLMGGGYGGSGNPTSHFLTGIPYAHYDLYLYFRHCETKEEDNHFVHFFSLREHDSDHRIAQIYAMNISAFSDAWVVVPSSSWSDQESKTPSGNVAVVTDLDLRDLHLISGGASTSWSQSGNARCGLCGLQIVERTR